MRIFYTFINHWQLWNDETCFHTWNLQWETFVQWTRASSFGNVGLWGQCNLKKHSVFGPKAWLGGGRSVTGVLHCFSSFVHGGLCSFGVLVCSATISRDCYSERNIINSWMQNKCGKLLQNQIMSFDAFPCATLYSLFEFEWDSCCWLNSFLWTVAWSLVKGVLLLDRGLNGTCVKQKSFQLCCIKSFRIVWISLLGAVESQMLKWNVSEFEVREEKIEKGNRSSGLCNCGGEKHH